MPNQEILDLLDIANHAIFEAEQAIRKEEMVGVNHPMYFMRLELAEITARYLANMPCSDFVPAIRAAGKHIGRPRK